MSVDNQSLFKTASDLTNDVASATANSVSTLRVRRDTIIRRLSAWQERVVDLRYNETLIKARLYASTPFASQSSLAAGGAQTAGSVQSFAPVETNLNGDHQSLYYSKAQTERSMPSFKELKSEADRITSEILELSQKINAGNKELQAINDKLSTNEANSSGVTLTKVETDRIARANCASVYFLLQLAQKYHDLSVPDNTGARQFPDNDPKRSNTLVRLMQTFGASASSFPQFKANLNLNDPGAQSNLDFLNGQMGVAKSTIGSKEVANVERKAQKFLSAINTTMQDTFNSEGIAKRPTPTAPPDNSLQAKTSNYVVAQGSFFGNPFGIGSLPTIGDSVSKAWKQKVGDTIGLPPCNLGQTMTDSDKMQQFIKGQEQKATSDAQVAAQKALETSSPAADLPAWTTGTQWWDYYNKVLGPPTTESRYVVVPNHVLYPSDTSSQVGWFISAAKAYTVDDASSTAGAGYEGYPEIHMHKEERALTAEESKAAGPVLLNKNLKAAAAAKRVNPTVEVSVYLLKYIAAVA